MAKFTIAGDANIRWADLGFEISGGGVTNRIPDSLVEEFTRDIVPRIAGGVTWITQDEMTSIVPEGWINVKTYGALGNNVADDTAEIQAAVNAGAGAGRTIYFPAGTYMISAAITVSVPLTLVGESGYNGSAQIRQVTVDIGGLTFTSNANGSVVRGLYIKGPHSTAATAGAGILTAKDTFVEDCNVAGFYIGLNVQSGSFYGRIDDSIFNSCKADAVRLDTGVNNFTATNCRFQYSDVGLNSKGANQMRVYGGSFERNTTYDLLIDNATFTQYSTADSAIISGVYFETDGPAVGTDAQIKLGVASNGVFGTVIRDCHFRENSGTGTMWHIDADYATSVLVEGCIFTSNNSTGGDIKQTANCKNWHFGRNRWNNDFTLAGTGHTFDDFVGVRLRNTGNISLNTSSDTPLTFDTETYDVWGFHSTSSLTNRVVVPAGLGGTFRVTATALVAANAGAGNRYLAVRDQSGTFRAVSGSPNVGNNAWFGNVSAPAFTLTEGQWCEVVAFQSSGNTVDVTASADYSPALTLERIGP